MPPLCGTSLSPQGERPGSGALAHPDAPRISSAGPSGAFPSKIRVICRKKTFLLEPAGT